MRTLLLADDSVAVQRVIALTFAQEALRVVSVSDGQAAIDWMASEPPDIVLAATAMSNVNGYEVARYVRSQPSLRSLPVLLLTGAFETVDPTRLEASGASGVIEKPLEPTTVISRVKELLGMKSEPATAASGRPVSRDLPGSRPAHPLRDASAPADRKNTPSLRPVPDAAARGESKAAREHGPAGSTEVVEGPVRFDYLETLESAFDSLDEQIAGSPSPDSRSKPAAPLAGPGAAAGLRPPLRRPPPSPGAGSGVTSDVASPNPIFEVDDEWFSERQGAQTERQDEQTTLAAEMRIQEVVMPERTPDVMVVVPDELLAAPPAVPVVPEAAPSPADVADEFAALLAFEQAEPLAPPFPSSAPVAVQVVAPEITPAMLDQIASRVADSLQEGRFADHIRDVLMKAMHETVRSVVSETSERLVREEIARVKAQAERETL